MFDTDSALLSIVFQILKYFILLGIAMMIYVGYYVLIRPHLFRWKYKKYPNVYMIDSIKPLGGDLALHMEDVKQDKVHYSHIVEAAPELNKYDLQVEIESMQPVISLVSNESIKEFCAMAPDKIDKLVWNRGVLKMVADSFAAHPSTEKTKGRRKDLTSILGLNSSSKYIPTMLEVTKEVLAEMKKLKDVNYLNHMNNLTVKILSNLLFGKDIHYLIEKKYTYQNHDGTSDELNLLDFFFKHCENLVAEYYNPITTLLPFVDKNNLFGLWKRNHVNDIQFKTRLTEIVEKSKDENSLWSQMKALNHYSSEDIFSDLIILLLGGTESTSHSLVSLFFYLAKHPDVKEKLVKELRDMGFHKNEELYHTKIHDCDYLNYVVKEVFRIDAPVTRGFYYVAKEDINIWNVPISKGTALRLDLLTPHFNTDDWKDPLSFVPERFDPESEFYEKAMKESKKAGVFSRRAFGHGVRSCPGQTFATLETKVIVAYLLTHMDFEVDESILNRENVGFGMGSHIVPKFKISEFRE